MSQQVGKGNWSVSLHTCMKWIDQLTSQKKKKKDKEEEEKSVASCSQVEWANGQGRRIGMFSFHTYVRPIDRHNFKSLLSGEVGRLVSHWLSQQNACHSCLSTSLSLGHCLNFGDLVCGTFWSLLQLDFHLVLRFPHHPPRFQSRDR